VNIKRGLKRIWIVGSVVFVIFIVGLTIYTFPEQLEETKQVQVDDSLTNEELSKIDEDLREFAKLVDELDYEDKKKDSLLILLKGLGVLVFMWGLLYVGFWISSGFSSDDRKKGETDE
jgi:flagellar basal body-associated protein FliL